MDMSTKLAISGQTTALGLLVVFVCLILIIVLITVLSVLLKDRKKEPKSGKAANLERKIKKAVEAPLPSMPVVEMQDDELLAVLGAAVAAYMTGEKSTNGLVVRSYRRINGSPAWSEAGRNAQIYNKF